MYNASATRRAAGMSIDVLSVQFDDGTFEHNIVTHVRGRGGGEQMTAAQARRLAAALLDAVDELERLA